MSPNSRSRPQSLSFIHVTVMLTVVLIISPFTTIISSPKVLKLEFASASSSSENDGESNTDAATDGDNQQQGAVQQEDGEEEDDDQDGRTEELFATVVGEICDDFEDNDGDDKIDLADEDCAGPATQEAITAPTAQSPPPSASVNTTATDSTNNTLTSGLASAGRPAYDLERDCDTYEELGIPPPPPGFGQPPGAKWYHCPPGVGVWVGPDGTSSLDLGGEGGSGVQQGLAQRGGVQAPPPNNTTTTPQVGQIQQQLQQLCAAAQQQGTSPATISPTTTNPEITGDTSYLGGYIPSSTRTTPVQAPPTPTTTPQVAQLQQLCTALQQQIEQLPTSPDSSGGTRSTTLPDGTVIVDNPDGPYVVTTPTGATITLSKPPEQPKDPNDLVTIDHPNGVSITWKRDGGEVAKYPGGIERTTNPFGRSVIKYPGGITIQCADGSIANVPEDGKWTLIEPPAATDIGERLDRFFFGSECADAVLNYLPLDEFLKNVIPNARGTLRPY